MLKDRTRHKGLTGLFVHMSPWLLPALLAAGCGGASTADYPVGAAAPALHEDGDRDDDDAPDAVVVSPTRRVKKKSYGEWSAAWWQWDFSLPVDHHPLFDTADCGTAQSGKVWFLGGTSFTTVDPQGVVVGTAERTCTVPGGTLLFFPIINAEQSAIESCLPPEGKCAPTYQDLLADARGFQDPAHNLSAEVDGVPIEGLNATGPLAPSPFRVQSPAPFAIGPLPPNNVLAFFNIPDTVGKKSVAVADGVFVMLKPLRPGLHQVHFHGEVDVPGFSFRLDITYHITVLGRGHEGDPDR